MRARAAQLGRERAAPEPVRQATVSSQAWHELVTSRASDVFHSPAWHRVLRDAYGFDVVGRLLLDTDGRPAAGMASCVIEDFRGRREVSLPFSDFCDPLVDNAGQWQALLADVPADAAFRTRTLYSAVSPTAAGLSATGRAAWHGIDLDRSLSEAWAAIDPGARRAVRKAETLGLEVRATAEPSDLRTFFSLHLQVRRKKYGLLAQPFRFLEAIHDNFLARGDGTLLLAEAEGEAVGGILLLVWGRRAYYKFNASRADGLGARPNDLLMWAAIRWATERGLELLDLGLSDEDQPGLLRYKRKYATQERAIAFLARPASRAAPAATQQAAAGELLSGLTALLTAPDVPDEVVERAGDLLYRYFA